MQFRTHVAGGCAAVSLAVLAGLLPPDPLLVAVGGAFALAPDIDHGGAKITRLLGPVGWLASLPLAHRGVTHGALSVLVVTALMLLLAPWPYAAAAGLGWASHLFLDAFTQGGIPVLWPNKRRFGPRLLKTGCFAEQMLVLPALVIVAALPWALALSLVRV